MSSEDIPFADEEIPTEPGGQSIDDWLSEQEIPEGEVPFANLQMEPAEPVRSTLLETPDWNLLEQIEDTVVLAVGLLSGYVGTSIGLGLLRGENVHWLVSYGGAVFFLGLPLAYVSSLFWRLPIWILLKVFRQTDRRFKVFRWRK